MAEKFSQAAVHRHLARVERLSLSRNASATISLAVIIEDGAKRLLTQTTHRAGDPTTARPGGPPALVTGQLRRSVSHEVHRTSGTLKVRVGPRATTRRAHGKRRPGSLSVRSTNATVGAALEFGLRGGHKYPWLVPAFNEGTKGTMATWRRWFKGNWR